MPANLENDTVANQLEEFKHILIPKKGTLQSMKTIIQYHYFYLVAK